MKLSSRTTANAVLLPNAAMKPLQSPAVVWAIERGALRFLPVRIGQPRGDTSRAATTRLSPKCERASPWAKRIRIRIRRHDCSVVGLTRRKLSSGRNPMVFIPLKDADCDAQAHRHGQPHHRRHDPAAGAGPGPDRVHRQLGGRDGLGTHLPNGLAVPRGHHRGDARPQPTLLNNP